MANNENNKPTDISIVDEKPVFKNFEFWLRKKFVYEKEAVLLLCGMFPYRPIRTLSQLPRSGLYSEHDEYLKKLVALKNAKNKKVLVYGTKIKPLDLMKWAIQEYSDLNQGLVDAALDEFPELIEIISKMKSQCDDVKGKAKNSLEKMVITAGVKMYGYVPGKKKNTAATKFREHMQSLGLDSDNDTISKWLEESAKNQLGIEKPK